MRIPLHAQAIRAAGGRAHLARVFGLSSEAVKSWPERGIPAEYWHLIVDMAAHKLPGLTIEALRLTKRNAKAIQSEAAQ